MRKRNRVSIQEVQERRAARRTELLSAAIDVIRAEGPRASMTRIAQRAGVSKPIVYRHFGDREGLYRAVAGHFVDELMTTLHRALASDLPPRELLVATIDAYVGFLERETAIYRFLSERVRVEKPQVEREMAGFRSQAAGELAVVIRSRLGPEGGRLEDAEAWAHGLVGMAMAAGEWWIQTREMPRERLVESLASLLWDGFSAVVQERDERVAGTA